MRPVTHFVLIGFDRRGRASPREGLLMPTGSDSIWHLSAWNMHTLRWSETLWHCVCVFVSESLKSLPLWQSSWCTNWFFFSSPWHVSRFICRAGCQTVSYRHLTPLTLPSHLWSLFWWHTGCFPKMFQSEWWGLGVFSVVLWEDRLLLSWCFYQLL